MKEIISIIILVSITFSKRSEHDDRLPGKRDNIEWAKAKDWKLYYTRSKKAFSFSADTLKNLKSVNMDQDSMAKYMATTSEIPAERTPVWMGYYVASCRLPNDSLIKIEISQYGRFFYADTEKRYYQLTDDVQDNWLAYLTAKWRFLKGVTE